MTKFVCDKCGTVDDTLATGVPNPEWLCHQCKTGTWHNLFPKRQYDHTVDVVVNRTNNSQEHPDLGEPSLG